MQQQLEELNLQIKELEGALLNNVLELVNNREYIDEIVIAHKVDIQAMQGNEGKKLYTNELQRDAALAERLGRDSTHKTLGEATRKLDESIKRQQIEADFLKRKFRLLVACMEARK